MASALKVSEDVLDVLSNAQTSGSHLRLSGQIDRKLYVQTNRVLEAAGAKWNRSAQAHVFEGDAAGLIEPIILTGEYTRTKQDFGQFDSPPAVVARVIELADIAPGMNCLEPSAGVGNLAVAAERQGAVVIAIEIDPSRAARAAAELLTGCETADFLSTEPHEVPYDRIVMNPPLAGQADIQHVQHALSFLSKDGGLLVSVMSAAVLFRSNALTRDFRALVEARGGSFERLPDNSFKDSGTSVASCIAVIPAA